MEEEESELENEADESEDDLPPCTINNACSNNAHADATITRNTNAVNSTSATSNRNTGAIRNGSATSNTGLITDSSDPNFTVNNDNQSMARLACPTCHVKCTWTEIEEHADSCCERSSSEAAHYSTWVLDSTDLTDNNVDASGNLMCVNPNENVTNTADHDPKELLQTLSCNIPAGKTQLVTIRRKYLW